MSADALLPAFRSARRLSATAIFCLAIAVVASAIALAFAAYAGQLALATRFPPEQAALIVAAGALVVALVLALTGWMAIRSAERRVSRAVRASALSVVGPGALALAARNTRLAGAAAALVVGVFAARRARAG